GPENEVVEGADRALGLRRRSGDDRDARDAPVLLGDHPGAVVQRALDLVHAEAVALGLVHDEAQQFAGVRDMTGPSAAVSRNDDVSPVRVAPASHQVPSAAVSTYSNASLSPA